MIEFGQFLAPPEKWIPLIESGKVKINAAANRVVWADSGKMAAALRPIPGHELVRQLTDGVATNVASQLQPALEALQLTSAVGAVASVANLGVSCVGFGLVLHRLSKIDGKLDEVLAKSDRIRASVDAIHSHLEALSVARMESAAESLSRALAADTAAVRNQQLASEARRLFQESRKLYLELWRRADPWSHNDFPVRSALELQGRFLAAAIGEMQAEFVIGDEGAFRHAVRSCARELVEHMAVNAPVALRARSDEACAVSVPGMALFDAQLSTTVAELKLARDSVAWSGRRLAAFEQDIDMAHDLGIEPFEVVRLVQSAREANLFLLGPPSEIDALMVEASKHGVSPATP